MKFTNHLLNTILLHFVIRDVSQKGHFSIDTSRIYLTDISQGCALGLRCAYEHSDVFAGVFVVSSGMLLDIDRFKTLDTPISVMKINTYEDHLVKFDGFRVL